MICPDCGAPLPDTAKMCYCCKHTFETDVQTNTAEVSNDNNRLIKENKKLYILLTVAIVLIVGAFGLYKMMNRKITYVSHEVFDYTYSVPDDWQGDGRLNIDETAYYYFDHGTFMVTRTEATGRLNEAEQEKYLATMESKTGASWSKEEIFYLNGAKSFYTDGYYSMSDGNQYKTRALITYFNGYSYQFSYAVLEKYYDSKIADEVLKQVTLPCMQSYTFDGVGYAVPSNWKEDKQYKKGLRFKSTDYEFVVDKKDIAISIEDENGPENQEKYYTDHYNGTLVHDNVLFIDGYPSLEIRGVCEGNPSVLYLVIYQVNGHEYTFTIRINYTNGVSSRDVYNIIDSIHIEN